MRDVLTGSGVDAKMMAVIMKYTTHVEHKCKTPWINITKKNNTFSLWRFT